MVLDNYRVEIPAQFKQHNILSLFESYDNRLREVEQVLEDIQFRTALNSAVGEQLDKIGCTVGLTRAEAVTIFGANTDMTDDIYRSYLRYKMYQNSSDCTYYNLIHAMKIVWDVEKIIYSENTLYPATIFLTAPVLSPGEEAHLTAIPAIRPAGVNVVFLYQIRSVIEVRAEFVPRIAEYIECGTAVCGTYPETTTAGQRHSAAVHTDAAQSVTIKDYPLSGTRKCGIYF